MKILKKVGILLIILISISMCFAKPYSEIWISSGDEFNLDEVKYEALISNSPIKILLKGSDGLSDTYSLGDCFETYFRKACFTEYQTMDNSAQQIKLEIDDKTPSISISIKSDNKSYFAGEEQEIIFTITIENETAPEEIYFESIIQENINIESNQHLQNNAIELGHNLSATKLNLKGNSSYEYSIDINSNYAKTYSIGGEVRLKYHGYEKVEYAKPIIIKYIPHFNLSKTIPAFNQSEDYEFEIMMKNSVNKELKQFKIKTFIPKYLNVITMKHLMHAENTSELGDNIFETYDKTWNLDENENESITFVTRHISSDNITIPLVFEYEYDKIKYFYEDRIEFNITINNSIKKWCTGDKDYNLTLKYDDATYFQKINGSDNIEDIEFFPGMDTNMRVYITSNVEEITSDVKISVYKDDELKLQKVFETIRGGQKVIAGYFNETIGFENYGFDSEIEYYCEETEEYFIQNGSTQIEVSSVEQLSWNKVMDEEMFEGDINEIKLNIKNEANKFIHNINVFEVIPYSFHIKGTTNKTFSIKNKKEVEAYTYFLTAPEVDEDTTFSIITYLTYEWENKTFNMTSEATILVKTKNETKITFEGELQNKGRLYEPLELTFNIKNEDDIKISNISIEIPNSIEYDVEKVKLSVPILYPEQEETFKIKIVPKTLNISIENISLNYESDKDNTPKLIKLEQNLLDAKIKFPAIDYTIKVLETLNGSTKYDFYLNNPSKADFKGIFQFNKSITNFELKQTESIMESYNIFEPKLSNKKENEEIIDQLMTEYIEYEYLNRIYQIYPANVSFNIEEEEIIVNETEHELNNTVPDEIVLEEVISKGAKITYGLIGVLAIIICTGVLIVFKNKNKKNKGTVEKTKFSKDDIENAEKSKITETHIVDEKSKEIIITKKENVESLIEEKEISEIKPTNIFSFSDYEKLKDEWNEKINK